MPHPNINRPNYKYAPNTKPVWNPTFSIRGLGLVLRARPELFIFFWLSEYGPNHDRLKAQIYRFFTLNIHQNVSEFFGKKSSKLDK